MGLILHFAFYILSLPKLRGVIISQSTQQMLIWTIHYFIVNNDQGVLVLFEGKLMLWYQFFQFHSQLYEKREGFNKIENLHKIKNTIYYSATNDWSLPIKS